MYLSKAIDLFLLSKQADGLSPNTARIYRYALSKLIQFAGDVSVENITEQGVRAWFIWLRTEYKTPATSIRHPEHLSVGTLQQIWRALRSFYTWAESELHIKRVDQVKMPEGESPVIQPFSEDEVRRILRAAEFTTTKQTEARRSYSQRRRGGLRNAALVLLLLDTALRIGEVGRLKVGDVDKDGGVTVAPFGSSRKSKPRIVQLGKTALRALWRYLGERQDADKDAPLFTTNDGKPLGAMGLTRLIIRVGKRAGVPHVHAHRFRHTAAIELLKNGMNVFELQRVLGHSTLEMVKRYLALATGDKDAHRRASPADKWRL